ncbi:MAG: nitroreductase family protein [Peptococcaceae bacterium]|nr:nitroreductase family protein [Peptococcaceae bacterium]
MSFLELAKRRYSVRKYEARQVEEEKLFKILEAGRVAPTAVNYQPQRLIVVREKEGLEKLKKAANVYDAPLAIIVCADHNSAWKRPFDNKNTVDIDASIVTDHMMLQATELGLGTVWICYFKPDVLRKEFNIPDHVEPVNILAIGYAAGEGLSPDRHDSARKPLKDTVFYETYPPGDSTAQQPS